jgi:PAS domain S-box-containing protein
MEAEERFERMFGANPAPAAICRLSDLRFVKINEGFLQLTGYERAGVLGRSVYEIDVLRKAERRELAVACLKAGTTIPQMEATLDLPHDPERHVIVAGQPIDIGDEPCMLFTFADLEDRHKAEEALRQSEERFATAFRLVPVPSAIGAAGTDDTIHLVDANEAFTATFGWSTASLQGRRIDELDLWTDRAEERRFDAELVRTGLVRGFEARLQSGEGDKRVIVDCLVSAAAVVIDARPCVLFVFQDITQRKRSEAELIAAIEAVMADASWFSRAVVEKLAALRHPAPPGGSAAKGGLDALSVREREVLAMICRGLTDAEIGGELKLSRNTVRNHVASLYRKIGVSRRSAVVVWGRERGIGGDSAPPTIDTRSKRQRLVRKHQID